MPLKYDWATELGYYETLYPRRLVEEARLALSVPDMSHAGVVEAALTELLAGRVGAGAKTAPSQSEVEIIAHRGFSTVAPENTLAAFWAAAGRAHSIEWDCDFSADGFAMVIHDVTVDRTTDGSGDVGTFTRAQLEALDNGTKFDARFAGARIPRLDVVLGIAAQSFRRCYPEIKRTRTGQRAADIATIVNAIKAAGLEDRCVIQSFNGPTDFPFVRALSRRITLGYLVSNVAEWNTALPLAAADGNACMLADYTMILGNPSFVTTARALGVDVAVWTVDSSDDARRLADIGITRIMSNVLSHTWAAR